MFMDYAKQITNVIEAKLNAYLFNRQCTKEMLCEMILKSTFAKKVLLKECKKYENSNDDYQLDFIIYGVGCFIRSGKIYYFKKRNGMIVINDIKINR